MKKLLKSKHCIFLFSHLCMGEVGLGLSATDRLVKLESELPVQWLDGFGNTLPPTHHSISGFIVINGEKNKHTDKKKIGSVNQS